MSDTRETSSGQLAGGPGVPIFNRRQQPAVQVVYCTGVNQKHGAFGEIDDQGAIETCPVRQDCRRYFYTGQPSFRHAPFDFEKESCKWFVGLSEREGKEDGNI